MKGLIVYGSDKALAQFYYAAFRRVASAQHEYRRSNAVCFTCNDDEGAALVQVAERLDISHSVIAKEDKYATVLRLVESFDPGERITTSFLMNRTGYTRWFTLKAVHQLIDEGCVEAKGIKFGRYFCRAGVGDAMEALP